MTLEEEKAERGLEKTITAELPFKETTELGEVFNNLDNDDINQATGFSNIDFNARLLGFEAANCMIFDELKALGILPKTANITMQKKRLSVSLGGLGRKEKVQIASGAREADLTGRGGGILVGIKKLFTPRGDNNG